jgi:hypothetical protein
LTTTRRNPIEEKLAIGAPLDFSATKNIPFRNGKLSEHNLSIEEKKLIPKTRVKEKKRINR